MPSPLVSVVVSTYNHHKYIVDCLESILMQETAFSFEVILGEDESSDGTREICKRYAEKYPDRIKLFLRSRKNVIYINGSPTGRYNFLENLKACKGKYIALCEGDDYWTDPLKLQKQVGFMEGNPEYNICFHEVQIYNQQINTLEEDTITRNISDITDCVDLARGNYIHTPSVIFRNTFDIPDWFVQSPLGDWTIYMLAAKDRKIYKMQDIMAVYRQHNDSIWSKKSKEHRIANTLKSFCLVNENLSFPKETSTALKEKIKFYKKQLLSLSK